MDIKIIQVPYILNNFIHIYFQLITTRKATTIIKKPHIDKFIIRYNKNIGSKIHIINYLRFWL